MKRKRGSVNQKAGKKKSGKKKSGAAARRSEFWREMYYEKNVMGTKGDPFK